MFGSKSPASLFSNLFDKREETEEAEAGEDEFSGRKRSQSMFAPSMAALMSGDHVGSRGNFYFQTKGFFSIDFENFCFKQDQTLGDSFWAHLLEFRCLTFGVANQVVQCFV